MYVCVDGFIVECPPPPSAYLALRANDQFRCFINIHLHYIPKPLSLFLGYIIMSLYVSAFVCGTLQ